MASGRLADYLGKGDAAERPASLDLHPEAVGFYYAEDTGEWSAWDGDQWISVVAGDGGGSLQVITEASAFTATPAAHAGLSRYIRAGGDVTFDAGEGYNAGHTFIIRATAAIELIGDGVTLEPTYGGTLELEPGMGVQVVFTSSTEADVNGLTVPAP